MLLAADCSRWGGLVTEREARDMASLGYGLLIVGGWHGLSGNEYAEESLFNARKAGLLTATYTALNGTYSGATAVMKCRQFCGDEWDYIPWVGVDCEVDGITHETIGMALLECSAQNKVPVIYTADWWWRGHFGNPTKWADELLWLAYYDNDPDIEDPTFGGWTRDKLLLEQFSGTVNIAGQAADRNVVANEEMLRRLYGLTEAQVKALIDEAIAKFRHETQLALAGLLTALQEDIKRRFAAGAA